MNVQLNKLKKAVKSNEGATLRFGIRNFNKDAKLRNALNNNSATDIYSRNNLPKTIKKGAYVINLDEYENMGTHWVALFVKANKVIYFDSFGIEHTPKEINKFIGNKKIKASIFRIQAYDSIMCRYFYIEFINYMLKDKKLLDYTNLFSPNEFKNNDQVIKRIFKNE